MPWLKLKNSLAYRLYAVFQEVLDLFMKPQIKDFFNDGRKKAIAQLWSRLHSLLQEVHKLEDKSDEYQ